MFHVEHSSYIDKGEDTETNRKVILISLCQSLLIMVMIIMLVDHYWWDIQQGQLLLWIILGLMVVRKYWQICKILYNILLCFSSKKFRFGIIGCISHPVFLWGDPGFKANMVFCSDKNKKSEEKHEWASTLDERTCSEREAGLEMCTRCPNPDI